MQEALEKDIFSTTPIESAWAQGAIGESTVKQLYLSGKRSLLMELVKSMIGPVTVVRVQIHHLDASNVEQFKSAITPAVEKESQVVLDLAALDFVDSSGLGAFLSCMRKVHAQGGEVKLANLSKPVRTLFELVRMHRIVEIFNSTNEAVHSFQ
jgi:anti-sigma B factor antagonist